MKYTLRYIFLLLVAKASLTQSFAEWDTGIFWDSVSADDLRNWNVSLDTIPGMIVGATNFLMGFAGTIAVIFVIIWAYQLLFGSLQQDKTKWRNTILMALGGFAIASLAWFIVKLIIDNFLSL